MKNKSQIDFNLLMNAKQHKRVKDNASFINVDSTSDVWVQGCC